MQEHEHLRARIKVIGVGGGGGNAVNSMIESGMDGVEFIVVNTDAQALSMSLAPHRFQLGTNLTKGLGAGAQPTVGRDAAIEDRDRLAELITDCDMIFITAGMGGGTGTGAAPVLAQLAKEAGILTVGVVTKPFFFEGKRRIKQAETGIQELKQNVDTLISIPNQRLIALSNENTTMKNSFKLADSVLLEAVRGVSDLIHFQGWVNVDFADVRTIMTDKGLAMMGVGVGYGDRKVIEATQKAIRSPLLENGSIAGARNVLVNITGNSDLLLHEVTEASTMISEEAHAEANVIWGLVVDESMADEVRVTVIATDLENEGAAALPPVEVRVQSTIPQKAAVGQRKGSLPGINPEDYDFPEYFGSKRN